MPWCCSGDSTEVPGTLGMEGGKGLVRLQICCLLAASRPFHPLDMLCPQLLSLGFCVGISREMFSYAKTNTEFALPSRAVNICSLLEVGEGQQALTSVNATPNGFVLVLYGEGHKQWDLWISRMEIPVLLLGSFWMCTVLMSSHLDSSVRCWSSFQSKHWLGRHELVLAWRMESYWPWVRAR